MAEIVFGYYTNGMVWELDEELFRTASPVQYETLTPKMTWEAPCWLSIRIGMRPREGQPPELFPITFIVRIDILGRQPLTDQVKKRVQEEADRHRQISAAWKTHLVTQIDSLVLAVEGRASAEIPMLSRADFKKAALAEILAQPASAMAIYFAMENYSKYRKAVLRIHTTVGAPGGEYLWFERPVPQRLEREDVVPWVRSTIGKLPKRKQPKDIESWMKKLVDGHTELDPWKSMAGESWNEKPRLILVFGTAKQIGFVAHWHLERQLIESFLRRGNRIEIRTSLRQQYNSKNIDQGWVFYISTPSSGHAEELENRMLSGKEIHFSLGPSIRGIAAMHGDQLDCIGLEHEMVEKEFARLGAVLVTSDPPHKQHRTYLYRRMGDAGITDVLGAP